jgi:hypothetical protein
MRSKVFISFLSLILVSYIDKYISTNNLYYKYILKEIINIPEYLHIIKIKNTIILKPLTSEQKLIFESFKIETPTYLNFPSP